MEDTVQLLIKEIRHGDQQAFAQIVEMYKTKVYNICLRLVRIPQEAEDLAQETFIRAYTNINRYENTHKFSTWLFRIATNLSIDYLRKKKPSFYLDADIPGTDGFNMYAHLPSNEDGPEQTVLNHETASWLQHEIDKLPPKYKTAITLKYIEDFSLKEISDIMGIPVATVKTRIHRGREALRKRMLDSQKR
ncbi:RNA polymerase sigma factor SigW [Tuberibacillus sp. Marseille-P3662]|uniref:RNA polymerase sigma factor SigW n=1 Tax=Tuberibacillus sp. Marseille-P3662 TaxID=1965358 RepID=UPI000A1CCFE7|nr:RNA polymerase sigma factor SigW [Tuberibacillus sp. Marseille-P3662]